jgi:hypothetical protein
MHPGESAFEMAHSRPEEPSMPRQTIHTHVGRVQFIADAYIQVSGEDPEDFVTDILADLQDWAAARASGLEPP